VAARCERDKRCDRNATEPGRIRRTSGGLCGPDPVQPPHAQAPPHAQPPEAWGRVSPVGALPAMNENCRRTRSPPHDGQARAVSTDAVIGRRSSNRCSHAMQRYSYAAIARGRIPPGRTCRSASAGFGRGSTIDRHVAADARHPRDGQPHPRAANPHACGRRDGGSSVIGLRRPNNPAPNPDALRAQGVRSARDAQAEPTGRSRRLRRAPRAEPGRRPAKDPSLSPTRAPPASPRSARPSRPASTGSS
jgi:hypothetical protein